MRTAPGPWADFETDKFMLLLPREEGLREPLAYLLLLVRLEPHEREREEPAPALEVVGDAQREDAERGAAAPPAGSG